MSKVGDKVLTEKTRVVVTISNFVMLIFTIISGVVFIVNWKADIENRLQHTENDIVVIKQEQKESNANYVATQTTLAEIQTDIKWLRVYLENE